MTGRDGVFIQRIAVQSYQGFSVFSIEACLTFLSNFLAVFIKDFSSGCLPYVDPPLNGRELQWL